MAQKDTITKAIWVEEDTHKKVKLEAAKAYSTMQQFIEIILNNYLEGEKK